MYYYYDITTGAYAGCGNEPTAPAGCEARETGPVIPEPPVQPISVSPRQIRQAITAAGMRTQVETAVAAGDQDLKDWWEFSTAVEENHPEVLGMATLLGLTDTQRHDLFVLARSK